MYPQSPGGRDVRELAATIYRESRPKLLSIAQAHATNATDAAEALQDALLLFIERFDPTSSAPPLAWLILTLKRRCWAMRSRRQRDCRVPLDPERDSPSAADIERCVIDRDTTRRRLSRLKPDERTALGLQAAGYSYREIAAAKHWTYTKVDRCIKEGRLALRAGGGGGAEAA